MGRIVVSEFVSLDGVVEAPGGEPGYRHTGWVAKFQHDEQIQWKFQEVLAHEALLLGRTTYESFAGAWPSYKGPFADRMNSMPKYVASTTLQKLDWNNAHLLQGDAMAAAARLKRELGGDILVHGSRTLANALKKHDLVDEYRLMVFPIILGSGMRLFEETPDAATLALIGTQSLRNGVAILTYRPARS
jgi:dihydrofolate reductase